jgi:hypothetical protein
MLSAGSLIWYDSDSSRDATMRSLLFCLAFAGVAKAQESPAVKGSEPQPLAAAWKDLLNADDVKATKAVLEFAKQPKEAVEFLGKNLQSVKADAKRIARLVEQLGDRNFATREAAQQELEYLGKFAKADLEKAKKENENVEAKDRVAKLLGRIEAVEKEEKVQKDDPAPANPNGGGASVSVRSVNGVTQVMINGKVIDTTPKVIEKLGPSATWVRAGRAIGILESLGTPEAQKVLEAISLGEDNATPTKQAQDALARLKRKK